MELPVSFRYDIAQLLMIVTFENVIPTIKRELHKLLRTLILILVRCHGLSIVSISIVV